MATGLPSQTQVIELLDAEFARAGYEIDDVIIDGRTRPPRITVIADGDTTPDLDTVAALSRAASTVLDDFDGLDGPYLLEVSSPGVDRPLTTEKHFRRARGRRVELSLADGTQLTGRVGATQAGVLALVVRAAASSAGGWQLRRVPLADIARATVQVEFSAPAPRELELAGVPGQAGETEARA